MLAVIVPRPAEERCVRYAKAKLLLHDKIYTANGPVESTEKGCPDQASRTVMKCNGFNSAHLLHMNTL